MMKRILLTGLLLAAIVLPPAFIGRAQDSSEMLMVRAGEVLEILPSHSLRSVRSAWILTRGREFLEAGQNDAFRTRIAEAGIYTLTLDITENETGTRLRRVLTLNVRPADEAVQGTSEYTDGSMVRTSFPFNEQGWIVLPEGISILRMTPTQEAAIPLWIDTDTTVDTNDDGDPANDRRSEDTFFSTEKSTIAVWFVEQLTGKQIALFSDDPEGTVQLIDVYDDRYARQQGIISASAQIQTSEDDKGLVSFTLRFDGIAPEVPMVTFWQFGDGEESMQTNPSHWYTNNGEYDITATAINVVTGAEVTKVTKQIVIENAQPPVTPPAVSSSSSTASAGSTESAAAVSSAAARVSSASSVASSSGGGGISWIMLALIFCGSMILGIIVLLIISLLRKRTKSLPERLEAMEKKIVEKEAKKKEQTTTEKTDAKKEEAPVPPTIAPSDAPAWLNAGTETPKAPPAPPAPPVAAPSAPAQESVTSEPTPEPLSETPLEPKPEPKTEPVPEPTPEAAPVQTPETTGPLFSEKPAPAAAPAPKANEPEPVPDWLQKGLTEAAKQGVTADTPMPADMAPGASAQTTPPAAASASNEAAPATPADMGTPDEAVPEWLKPQAQAPVAEPVTEPAAPNTEPQPQASANPPPEPTTVPAPAPQTPQAEPLPDWLKPQETPATPEPATPPEPTPPAPAPQAQPEMVQEQKPEPQVGRPGEALPRRLSQPQQGPRQQNTQQRPQNQNRQNGNNRPNQNNGQGGNQQRGPRPQQQNNRPQNSPQKQTPPPPSEPVPPPTSPETPPAPTPTPKPQQQSPQPQPIPPLETAPAQQTDDSTVGFLRVESLEEPKTDQNPPSGQDQTPPANA